MSSAAADRKLDRAARKAVRDLLLAATTAERSLAGAEVLALAKRHHAIDLELRVELRAAATVAIAKETNPSARRELLLVLERLCSLEARALAPNLNPEEVTRG